jgi:hypothetical protein
MKRTTRLALLGFVGAAVRERVEMEMSGRTGFAMVTSWASRKRCLQNLVKAIRKRYFTTGTIGNQHAPKTPNYPSNSTFFAL